MNSCLSFKVCSFFPSSFYSLNSETVWRIGALFFHCIVLKKLLKEETLFGELQ